MLSGGGPHNAGKLRAPMQNAHEKTWPEPSAHVLPPLMLNAMEKQRKKYLECPCGELLEGTDDDTLVAAVQAHLRAVHPHLTYDREQILLMAR
ncbi:hypothetical protein GCM10027162_06190 [Streptomyces incanus]